MGCCAAETNNPKTSVASKKGLVLADASCVWHLSRASADLCCSGTQGNRAATFSDPRGLGQSDWQSGAMAWEWSMWLLLTIPWPEVITCSLPTTRWVKCRATNVLRNIWWTVFIKHCMVPIRTSFNYCNLVKLIPVPNKMVQISVTTV